MNNYKKTKTTVSSIKYHFVFCPRYRRKIFNIPNVENRFKELVINICKENDFEIIRLDCDKDHIHLFIEALPQWSPSLIMQKIKGGTGYILRHEFEELSRMPNLWTRSFFCSTAGDVSADTIKMYVESQKRRPNVYTPVRFRNN